MRIDLHRLDLDDAAIIDAIDQQAHVMPGSSLAVASGSWSGPKVVPNGAYHGSFGIEGNPSLRALIDSLDALADGALTWEAWGNLNPPGSSVGLHDHATGARGKNNKLSAVYFPADHPAELVFPDFGIGVKPRRGIAVVFPPDAAHLVDTNWISRTRYSIALNAY